MTIAPSTPRAASGRPWTVGTVWRRAREVLGKEGARSLFMRTLGETIYRRMIVMERPFNPPISPVPARIPVEFAPLELHEIEEYLESRPDADRDETITRLKRRHVCYVARHKGRIVTSCRIATERAWIDYLGAWIRVASSVGYLYELYTPPEYRGQNVGRAMFPEIFRYFGEVASPCVLAAFNPENRIQLVFSRLGFRPVATIGVVAIGPWRRLLRRTPPGEQPTSSFHVTFDEAESFLPGP